MATAETVVLVHGLWMHGAAMMLLKHWLARKGYRVLSHSYPSVRVGLAENARRFGDYHRALGPGPVHVVAHSLGGLVVLRALETASGSAPGRVVLLGPPFVECHAARCLVRLPGGRTALGRSIPEWLEGPRPVLNGDREIGVIAGRKRLGLGCLVARDLPSPNDGVVSVAETRVPGMRDHVVLDVSHSGMLVSRAVACQIGWFLSEGRFAHDGR